MGTNDEALAEFRRKREGGKSTATQNDADDRWDYEAFKISPEPNRFIEVRTKSPEMADAFSYGLLTRVLGEQLMGSGFTLLFAYSYPIKLNADGKRLHELFKAFQQGRVEWIQEFDPVLFKPVTDETAPIIETIEIIQIMEDGEKVLNGLRPLGNA
jgi:hypothetical protein